MSARVLPHLLFAILWVLCVSSAANDPSEIIRIRREYQAASDTGWYRTTIVENVDSYPAPGVGEYRKEVAFHWDWVGGDPKILKFARVTARIAAPYYEQEYLFDTTGALRFAFIRGGYSDTEKRYYFAQGKLIRFMEADSTFDTPSARHRERGEEVKKRAGALRAVFAAMEHMPP